MRRPRFNVSFTVSALLLTCIVSISTANFSLAQQQRRFADSVAVRSKSFVEALASHRYGEVFPMLDSMMTSMIDSASLADTWERIIKKAGAMEGITGVRVDTQASYIMGFVTCRFAKGEINVKVVFDHNNHVAGFFFEPAHPAATYSPAPYIKTDLFREKLVTVGTTPWILHGVLSVPKKEGRVPAIVLVHGSGPEDRDETIGPNKPFRDLAQGLASKGIAVLRYDKRTHELAGEMTSMRDSMTVKEETIDDALAAVKRLRTRDEIDPSRIYVLGHSLGGMLAPRIAQQDTGIAGLIVFAGTARPLEDVILDQMEYLNGGTSKPSATQSMLAQFRKQVAAVKSPALSLKTPSSELPLGSAAAYWLYLRGYHPAEVAAQLHKRILVLQGQRDYQVTEKDFAIWKKSLGGRKDITFKLYPGLNHLFITGTGKSMPAEYELAGHVSEKVINDIAAWVLTAGK